MSHYKRDASSNRDALFGGGGGSSSSSSNRRQAPSTSRSSRPTPPSASARPSSGTSSKAAAGSHHLPSALGLPPSSSTYTDPHITPGPSLIFTSAGRTAARSNLGVLTGEAKIAKLSEAEDYRLKAKKCMTRGIFSKPDPISAANFYKRAADAYKVCGENRLERLHRIASGDCQLGQDAYATAAAEYTRAAELAETSDETLARKRKEVHKLHFDAANAWVQMGEKGRAAESRTKAAFGLIMGDEVTKQINPKALLSVEEAVESFVPDPLNRKRNYRRTGVSAYINPNADDADAAMESAVGLARQNIITDSFAHEALAKVGNELIKRHHYESALYTFGASTATLENEGFATVSLSRAYVSETILTLAMGDTVAARQDFQQVHLQRTSYLSSRECALAEDLVRACDAMDGEALDETRSRSGQHRSAMANLDPTVRDLVGKIRVSGRVKTKKEGSSSKVRSSGGGQKKGATPKPEEEQKKKKISAKELVKDTDAAFDEMDDIMNQMGLGGEDEDDDDDIDLT